MIRAERFIAKLKELDYKYRGPTDRCHHWRKGDHDVYVRRRDCIPEAYVWVELVKAGVSRDEITSFLAAARL